MSQSTKKSFGGDTALHKNSFPGKFLRISLSRDRKDSQSELDIFLKPYDQMPLFPGMSHLCMRNLLVISQYYFVLRWQTVSFRTIPRASSLCLSQGNSWTNITFGKLVNIADSWVRFPDIGSKQ